MEERNPRPESQLAKSRGEGDSIIARVLVIEPDPDAAERLRQPLDRAGLSVVVTDSIVNARPLLFEDGDVSLALVGIRLPNGDARELCREVRAGGGPPVILVGDRAHEQALIAGLQVGADDYLVEPVRTGELLARVGVALRRRVSQPLPRRRRVGPLTVDPATRTATIGGQRVGLTPREYTVLLALAQTPGQVVSRDELLSRVWGSGWMGTSKVLDVQISSLRRKLDEIASGSDLIRTVRGVGFLLAPPDDDRS